MKARILVLVTAAVVALVGVGAVVLYAQGANSRAVAGAKPAQVYVSQKVIPAGTALKDAVAQGLVARTNLPQNATPAGALTEVTAQNQNLVAVTDVQAGEYILSARFSTQAVGTQAISVPKGTIAVSAELSDPARVGAFMTPGSRIVIFDTQKDSGTAASTQVLLEDVLVIAVGDSKLTPVEGGADTTATDKASILVTVALEPKDATRLVHAIQTGDLYAGLEGTDVSVSTGTSVDDSSLFAK